MRKGKECVHECRLAVDEDTEAEDNECDSCSQLQCACECAAPDDYVPSILVDECVDRTHCSYVDSDGDEYE